MIGLLLIALWILCSVTFPVTALHVVLSGGTGPVGRALAPRLGDVDVTILTRNAFLAAAPSRVTEQFGYFGQALLAQNPHVKLRDWDGGDLLDIVGQDWMGWQQDCLTNADVVVHLTGGYTTQRVMACERLIRESYAFHKDKMQSLLHVTVNPTEQDLALAPPLIVSPDIKRQRIAQCEAMVQANCPNYKCLRVEANRIDDVCAQIEQTIQEWAVQQQQQQQ